MTQREFNQLIQFQPAVEPFESLRDIVDAWFCNELGQDAYDAAAKAYMEAIRSEFVKEEG